jgi:uncharacterized membrane protein YwzB
LMATIFIDPLQAHDAWYLMIVPMVVFIAVGYKAVRTRNMDQYWREVLVFVIQVLGGMGLLALAFMVVINFVVPVLAPR